MSVPFFFSSVSHRHGDMLYLSETSSALAGRESPDGSLATLPASSVKEDEIDRQLSKQDGLIHRDRDPQL